MLVEAIARDMETLRQPEHLIDPPGRAFYEARIAMYRSERSG